MIVMRIEFNRGTITVVLENGMPVRFWQCDKCGEIRTNKETHVHRQPMSRESMKAYAKAKEFLKEKEGEKDDKRGSGSNVTGSERESDTSGSSDAAHDCGEH